MLGRQTFLQTDVTLLGTRGYSAPTVPLIVQATGSSTGAFYSYFRNKDDLFAAALTSIAEAIAASLRKIVASSTDPRIQLRRRRSHHP